MARFSPAKVEDIIKTADIVDVISEFVPLQSAGKNMKGLCPFHSEKTPSFFVSKERQLFNCFGCGEKGNVIQFITKYKHLEYWDAVNFLASKYNIEPDLKSEYKPKDNKDRYYRINELTKKFFTLQLLNLETGSNALDYLKNRGFDESIISFFELGFASKNDNSLYETLSKDFNDYELIELGLIGKNPSGYFDIFRNKIMFPIHDEHGKVIGFSGRIFNNEENTAKYVNSTQTDLFIKSNVLYNLDKAIPFINQNKRLVLMEGFFDVMSAFKAGIKEAVCSMGTALTINQAKLIKKYTDSVVVCYDGDDAGLQAAYKALILLGQAGLDVKVAMLPNKMDPDDFIKTKGPDSFRTILKDNLYDQYDFVYEVLIKKTDLNKPSEIEKTKIALFEYLNKVASSTIREIYIRKFSNDTKVNYDDVIADYHYFQLQNARLSEINRKKEKAVTIEKTVKKLKKIDKASETVINYYATNPDFRDIIDNKFSNIKMADQRHFEFLYTMTTYVKKTAAFDENQIKKDFSDITEEELNLFREKPNKVYTSTELNDCLDTLIINKLEIDIAELKKKVNEEEDKEKQTRYYITIQEKQMERQKLKEKNKWQKNK